LQPDFAYVHNDLGNALAEAGGSRSDEVLYHYERAAELAPTMAEAHSNVGTALKEKARHAEAAARYELAISIKPTLCEAYKNLGSSYTETARLPEALVAFRGALRVNPQFWPALYA
jgi:tetratricopeptide (TPR) repeat protein